MNWFLGFCNCFEMDKHKNRIYAILLHKEENKKMAKTEQLFMHLEILEKALEDYDFDTADLVCKEICRYIYPADIQPIIEELKENVRDFMADEAIVIIERLRQI